jgi:glycosyltransferase involved in cell wall biosynthesis
MCPEPPADVCLVLEGTYPYVAGGVSSWAHNLLCAQADLKFHLVCLVPRNANLTPRYPVPPNVTGITHVEVGLVPKGAACMSGAGRYLERLETPLNNLQHGGGLDDLAEILALLNAPRAKPGGIVLLDSPEAWDLLLRMYRAAERENAFLDYFWTWRNLFGALYSILLAPIPRARLYHALCTGYAGLFAARARLETGRPALLTEHGIYTNERRIEIAMAEWLYQTPASGLSIDQVASGLKEIWVNTFIGYSRACYEAASQIVTLYTGNQQLQLEDGADSQKLAIIPNGVDYEFLSRKSAERRPHAPTVALIGRVVPIKDIKTYIRSIAILREIIPETRALLLGPTDEDPQYFAECQALVHHLGLDGCFTFEGQVSVAERLPELDVVVLTSISEAQPLVLLEAGAAGVPCVATDVGACREIIRGGLHEMDSLGAGGEVIPLSNPTAAAQAIARLLTDRAWWESASHAMRERVRLFYNKPALDQAYRQLYDHWRSVSLHWKGAA